MTEQMCSAQITRMQRREIERTKSQKVKVGERARRFGESFTTLPYFPSARARFHFTNPARGFTISERIEQPKEARRRGERGGGEATRWAHNYPRRCLTTDTWLFPLRLVPYFKSEHGPSAFGLEMQLRGVIRYDDFFDPFMIRLDATSSICLFHLANDIEWEGE